MGKLMVIVAVVAVIVVLAAMIRILREYERGVIFRLGRLKATRGPGLILLIPFIEQMVTTSLRTVAMEVPQQDAITKDNTTIKVSAVVYFKVESPERAVTAVEDYEYALSQLAQTSLRSVIGSNELDTVLGERVKLQDELGVALRNQTEKWGIAVDHVEMKNIDLPIEMQRAMAKQSEAERERRAKVIHAEGELQASQKLAEAAQTLNTTPGAMQLRTLQTMTEIAVEKNSTILFPYQLMETGVSDKALAKLAGVVGGTEG